MAQVHFVHTADINLSESNEDSLELLRWLMAKCVERGAALLVAGNLFKNEVEAEKARIQVMEIFSEAPDLPKYILPGSRDMHAYQEGINYGTGVFALNESPFTFISHEDMQIIGVPYLPHSSLRSQLEAYVAPERPAIALVYGAYLGVGKSSFVSDFHERGEDFFPIYGSDIDDIEANYLALGGYYKEHESFIHGKTVLCYPGTPIALSSHQTGIRTVVAVTMDSETGDVEIERLPVPVGNYNIQEEIHVFACYEEEALDLLEQTLENRADNRACMTVRFTGNTRMLVTEINERLNAFREKSSEAYAKLEIRNETTSYRGLIETRPLVRDFIARLALKEDIDQETKARALELGLHAFDRLKDGSR